MFYDNLKAECDRQGLKITPIVLECGGNKGSLSGWKNGASPNSNIVIALAIRLNVSTDYLLLGKDNLSSNNISNSTVGAVGNNSSGTITINNNSASENKELHISEQAMSENAKELLKVFENLPTKEQVKLLNIVYDLEEQYHKSNT